MMVEIADHIRRFYETFDRAIEKLSEKQEGKISGLPTWAMANREIVIGVTPSGGGLIVGITPKANLTSDTVNLRPIDEVIAMLPNWTFDPNSLPKMPFTLFGQPIITVVGNPLAPPVEAGDSLVGAGQLEGALNNFSSISALQQALQLWNNAVAGSGKTDSFVYEAKQIFMGFRYAIKRKAFLERRVHRFINEHARLLLPQFRQKLFEHPIYLENEVRVADFILEREPGLPALLVELESPVHKVFRKNGELTAEANHAKNQIAEWVAFIDQDAQRNASGDFAFLAGPKQRLVIMGRGMEHREKLLRTKFTDTTIWTYDLLLEHAINRWNDEIAAQCRLIGLEPFVPFPDVTLIMG